MKHGIPLFDDVRSEGWGIFWLLSGLATLVAVIFTAIMVGWIAPAVAIPWGLLCYGIFGHHFFNMDTKNFDRWNSYKNLPAEHRNQIGMSRREFANMTDSQRGEVASKVSDLNQIITNRNEGMTMPAELRTRFDAVLQKEKSAYQHEKEVKTTMKELGYDE